MRDFYPRVIGLTVTEEAPHQGSCFLSADPEHEHRQLALGESSGPDNPEFQRYHNTAAAILERDRLSQEAKDNILGNNIARYLRLA